jgi:hypothetical protein
MLKITPNLNYRFKTLLGLLKAFGGRLPSMDFQKYLFLFTKEFEKEPSFEFIPYRFGCFSFQSYADKRRLIEIGALQDSEDWRLKDGFKWHGTLFEDDQYLRFQKRYVGLKGDKLIQDLYRRYPYYAINSEIAELLMTPEEIAAIDAHRPFTTQSCLFTIGYEGGSFENYLNRLIKHNIRTLVDVRRNPLSRKYGFSKKTLSETTKKLEIEYVHIPELGIASEKRQELNTQSDYDRLFDSYEKIELRKNKLALDQLADIVTDRKRVAITCFEARACMCHRGRVAKILSTRTDWSYTIQHI